jgi:hypothetical protein
MEKCRTAREAALAALVTRAELAPEAARHVAECAACRAELSDLKHLWQDLGRLPAPTVAIPDAERVWLLARSQPEPGRIHMRRTNFIAALFACLLAGGLTGYVLKPAAPAEPAQAAAPASAGNMFLLLLHEAPELNQQFTADQMTGIVKEYTAWAGRLSSENRLVSAEKLRDDKGRWLAPSGPLTPAQGNDMVSGFFLIRARDYDEALELARQSPHLKYGGTIEVRAIENTGA